MSRLLEGRHLGVTPKTGRVSNGVIRAHRLDGTPRQGESDSDPCHTQQHEPGDRLPAKLHAAALRRRSHHIATGPTSASARIGGDT